ncbi:MAG TPA: PleD family two-component system response regulator [Beijerinckiaceae bacterium]|nr:PleD family two-component system response regulator [Beijerinckiaceae bacterium]
MTARILVVDDLFPNIKLLETRLTAEYFDVLSAMNGMQAIEICESGACDIVLLDVMMPGMDGFEVCRRLKNSPTTAHLPVVIITALDQPSDRIKGLEAGADDFLTKPVNDVALLTRVRSLARLKTLTDELRARAATSAQFGQPDALASAAAEDGLNGRVLLVDDRSNSVERMVGSLQQVHTVCVETDPQAALMRAAEENHDLAIISLGMAGFDALRLCSQLRSLERTRNLPVLVLADLDDDQRVLKALDLGVNDYLTRPIDRNELVARVRTQIRRKRYADRLRQNVQSSMEMAIIDPLTKLHNRRYLTSHLAAMLNDGMARGTAVTLAVIDVDFFKKVNDTYGHDAGDEVLVETAARLRRSLRGIDILARFGGEEFVVAMPDTDRFAGVRVAERLRASIEGQPFTIHKGARQISITASIGVATASEPTTTADTLVKRADEALYEAKRSGRNRVIEAAA